MDPAEAVDRAARVVAVGLVGRRCSDTMNIIFLSWVSFLSTTEPWMIQFGGHHLGLNITLVGDKHTLAPSHTGLATGDL